MKTTYALISAAVGALAQDTIAEVVADNPPGSRYIASFDGGLFLSGQVLAGSDAFGRGITYHVSLSGLPEEKGPFNYYVHEDPVPEGGDCEGTGGHLDPYGRTGEPACDDDSPETCEVGDLSGKHGTLDGSTVDMSLLDLYTSLSPDHASFIGNRSFVVHSGDGTRLACANFEEVPEDPVDEAPSETTPEESSPAEKSPIETAPVESSTAEESPVGTSALEEPTAAPEEPEDDECEAEEPEAEVPDVSLEVPTELPTEAPVESTAEEIAAETTAEEAAPARPTVVAPEPPVEEAPVAIGA